MVRPTIMLMIRSIEASFVSTVAMYWPSRITVTRSEMSFSSSSRWEMWTTPTPFARTARMMRKSSSISVSVSVAVGSSMIRTCALYESAFAISTICCCATLSFPTLACGSTFRLRLWKSVRACSLSLRWSMTNGIRARGSRPLLARSFGLLVQQRRDVRRVDVRLVVPVEARVDVLRYRLLVQYLPGRLDRLEPDADRVLGDRAGLVAAADRVHLLLAGVVPDDHDPACLTRFLHAGEHADGRTLVRAEHALEVRVRLQDRFRDIRRFELVATAVLSRDDLDVRVLALDLVGEALDAVDAGAARLVVRDDRDVAAHADERRHLVRRRRGRRDVVRRRGRYRDVAVDT